MKLKALSLIYMARSGLGFPKPVSVSIYRTLNLFGFPNLLIVGIFSLFVIVMAGCNKLPEDKSPTVPIQNETPETFAETKDVVSALAYTRKGSGDIVDKLYQEALKGNEALERLNDRIEGMNKIKNEGTRPFEKYHQNNLDYYRSVDKYLGRLNDTTLREPTKSFFDDLEAKFENRIVNHKKEIGQVRRKALNLNDQLILIKLAVTGAMIQNYEVNELPDIKELKKLVDRYESLIEESKEINKLEN